MKTFLLNLFCVTFVLVSPALLGMLL